MKKLALVEETYAKELKALTKYDLSAGKKGSRTEDDEPASSLRSALSALRAHITIKSERHAKYAKTIRTSSLVVLDQGLKNCRRFADAERTKRAAETTRRYNAAHLAYRKARSLKMNRKQMTEEEKQRYVIVCLFFSCLSDNDRLC